MNILSFQTIYGVKGHLSYQEDFKEILNVLQKNDFSRPAPLKELPAWGAKLWYWEGWPDTHCLSTSPSLLLPSPFLHFWCQ